MLYEGYLLYPYRASSVKNQFRWQFGVVAPHSWGDANGEPWLIRTECLIAPQAAPRVSVTLRFLQLQEESPVERTIDFPEIPMYGLVGNARQSDFHLVPLYGKTHLACVPVRDFLKLQVVIENHTELAPGSERGLALRHSMIGAHLLLTVDGGDFVSLTDPPAEAAHAAQSCINLHTWPVLIGATGGRDTMLSSPIILPDYPEVAPESPGDLFDSTEIDEILTLRVMTLTDQEKAEACAADDRARRIIERSDSIPREIFERLHGAVRSLKPVPLEDFFNPPDEDPERAQLPTPRGAVSKGARVRLMPNRRSDSMDMFLAGRSAKVEGIHRDVENQPYVAVRLECDEGAEVLGPYARFYFFYPDEIELMEESA
ncbi:MAG: hypothetical protein ABI759_11225 [Candidatus Solibacter sp.]